MADRNEQQVEGNRTRVRRAGPPRAARHSTREAARSKVAGEIRRRPRRAGDPGLTTRAVLLLG
jgi:hypothetical protein